jgi:hypothetical protein
MVWLEKQHGGEKPILPSIRKEEDLFQKAILPKKDEGKFLKMFKESLLSDLNRDAGRIAFAIEMCDNPKFSNAVREAFLKREEKGHTGFMIPEFDPLEILGEFNPKMSKSKDFYYGLTMQEELQIHKMPQIGLNELANPGKIRYADLKKVESSYEEVSKKVLAWDYIANNHLEEYTRILALQTLSGELDNTQAAKFIDDFLQIAHKKNLYEGEFCMADIGTSGGWFSHPFVTFIRRNFDKNRIVRTDVIKQPVSWHTDLEVKIHDITESPIEGKHGFHVIIVKELMKFFNEKGTERIWGNVAADTKEGGVVISGEAGSFEMRIGHKGGLVKVNPEAFLKELRNVKNYQDYLDNLNKIIERSA